MKKSKMIRCSKGFTLIELLIVVAIIGVLSVVGVPTYRKMVTKARKSEAKVALGGLFTIESAFFSEYRVYGNRLDKIGFDLSAGKPTYVIGFPGSGDCSNAEPRPLSTSAAAEGLTSHFADYFQNEGPTVVRRSVAGQTAGVTMEPHACYVDDPHAANASILSTTIGVSDSGDTFAASATGNIAAGVSATGEVSNSPCALGACQDAWVIDNNGILANVVDGTN